MRESAKNEKKFRDSNRRTLDRKENGNVSEAAAEVRGHEVRQEADLIRMQGPPVLGGAHGPVLDHDAAVRRVGSLHERVQETLEQS